jgi:hypothetical protein
LFLLLVPAPRVVQLNPRPALLLTQHPVQLAHRQAARRLHVPAQARVLLPGLEKTRFFYIKNQPSGFFWVSWGFFGFLGFFWVFWVFLGFLARTRGFLGFFQFHEYFWVHPDFKL